MVDQVLGHVKVLVAQSWLCLIMFLLRSSQGHTPRVLLNALDESGFAASIQFLALRPPNVSATLFLHKHIAEEMSSSQSQKEMFARQTVGVSVHHYSVSPFPDKSRSRIIKQQEQVSYILEALQKTMGEMRATGGALLSLTLKNGVKMHPTPQFSRIFGLLDGQAGGRDVLLLPKNRGLTSISDWHDLFVLGINASKPEAHEWLDAFASTYRHHADRQAFTVLEPRPALLAANAKTRARTNVGFFSHEDIRRVGGEPEDSERHHQHARGLLEVFCHEVRGEGERCMVNEPTHWLRRVERGGVPKTYTSRVVGNHLKASELEQHLPHGMWDGSLRFFKPLDDVTPRPFCWETSTTEAEEQVAPARLVFNATLSLPYQHPAPGARPKATLSAVMLTGMEVSAHRLDQKLYINLSKMMYCKRHGYKFLQLSSNQFRHYFDPHTFENMTNGNKGSDGGWFSGYMSKVPMVATALLQNADKEWVVWTDDDVYLNPGWSYLSLDAFLADVPKDKVFVAGNYRSSFTNIFALRNSDAGRRLVIDWLAVAQSGYVECHGYDQAAIQTLILLRAARTMDDPFPFNHTCLWSQAGETGCNMKGDWSCDFDFERSMYFAGFKSEMQTNFFDLRISSYTKGCANAAIPDFHVITESSSRPRFQCGHCTRLSEVFSSGHWDGPLGGGNDKHRRGGINGWFSNHKAEFLFWEGFLNPKGCARVEGVVPLCDHGGSNNGSSSASPAGPGAGGGGGHGGRGQHTHHTHHAQGGHAQNDWERHIISIVDGFGFDLRVGAYCRITDPVALKQQHEGTYMKDYPTLIRAGRAYSDERWRGVYRNFSGGEGRAPCQGRVGPGTSCDHGQGQDGQKQKAPLTVESENEYFERAPDYCSGCVSITRPRTAHSPAVAVVDCRLERDVKAEYVRNQSQVMDAFDLRAGLFPNRKR